MVRRPSRVLMATGPGLVELRFTQKGPDHRPSVLSGRRDDHPDSAVRVFSERSRRNLQKAALRFPWHEVGRLVLITLTYPADFPLDGRLVKRQVKELWRRWEREYGERPRGIWGLEFQDRGAPHFHAFLGMPRGVDYDDLRGWGFVAWSSIVDFRSVLVPLVGFGGPCAFVDPWAENHYRLENCQCIACLVCSWAFVRSHRRLPLAPYGQVGAEVCAGRLRESGSVLGSTWSRATDARD